MDLQKMEYESMDSIDLVREMAGACKCGMKVP